MSDPRHAHAYQPTRKGRCGRIVGSSICHLPEDAPVHVRARTPDDDEPLPRPYREHLCPNGHRWRAPVSKGHASHLSGEREQDCPTCGERPRLSYPWTLDDGSPYPFDRIGALRAWPEEWT